ncbi:hypothetical protein [Phaeobacter inhibens]|uniref:hypothetical protein n=1 Tax=Phaeobacter inhibens TaxID=221822 RepID=UPI0021A5581E|nr:hypothetical protein [Phaeobacter inhibens]UWR44017.1 hypothetical protein K4F86_11680 [Phaeobacter inhibens]
MMLPAGDEESYLMSEILALDDLQLAQSRVLTVREMLRAFGMFSTSASLSSSAPEWLEQELLVTARALLTCYSCDDATCVLTTLHALQKSRAMRDETNLSSHLKSIQGCAAKLLLGVAANAKGEKEAVEQTVCRLADEIPTMLPESPNRTYLRYATDELVHFAAASDLHYHIALWANEDAEVAFPEFWVLSNQPSFIPIMYFWKNDGSKWKFWLDWYQGFLDGKPLDWELQRRVALIGDAIWEAGPEAVAAEIERVRSLFELEQEIANLKEQLTAVQNTPAAALIGDNGGPPLEDAPARAFQTDLALIWKQVEELEEEIAKPSPSPLQLEKIAKALWDICLRMAAYCGSIADGMIREGTKELAKAGAKWTARATAVTVTAQTEGVQSVVKAIGAFVKTLQ